MSIVFSDNFNEGQAAFQANWLNFFGYPTLNSGGATAGGFWISCSQNEIHTSLTAPGIAGLGSQASLRVQMCAGPPVYPGGPAGEPLVVYGIKVNDPTTISIGFFLDFFSDGSFGFRMNNVLSQVFSPASLYPTNGTMFGLQYRLTRTGNHTIDMTVTVNDVDVWVVTGFDWTIYDGGSGGISAFGALQLYFTPGAIGINTPYIDNVELDNSAAAVSWPAVAGRSSANGCSGIAASAQLSQLPIEVAYAFNILRPYVVGEGLNWLTPPPDTD